MVTPPSVSADREGGREARLGAASVIIVHWGGEAVGGTLLW